MSKRDYENIARIIRINRQYNLADRTANEIIDNIVGDLAATLSSNNENFDEERFVAACEYQP